MTMQYVKPTEVQIELMQRYRDKYEALLKEVKKLATPDGSRGLSLAITKLEESAMWLNKSITNND